MLNVPSILIELVDPPNDIREDWRRWFDGVYLPAHVAVSGVRAARRGRGYQNVGSQAIADADPVDVCLFELESVDVSTSPQWNAAEEKSAGSWLERHRSFADATVLAQTFSTVDDYVPPALDRAELLHGAFYDMPKENQSEFNDWYNTEHIPIQMAVPGYLNARRFQGVDDPELFVALYDVVKVQDTQSEMAKRAMQSAWSERMRNKLARKRARRLFVVETLQFGPIGAED